MGEGINVPSAFGQPHLGIRVSPFFQTPGVTDFKDACLGGISLELGLLNWVQVGGAIFNSTHTGTQYTGDAQLGHSIPGTRGKLALALGLRNGADDLHRQVGILYSPAFDSSNPRRRADDINTNSGYAVFSWRPIKLLEGGAGWGLGEFRGTGPLNKDAHGAFGYGLLYLGPLSLKAEFDGRSAHAGLSFRPLRDLSLDVAWLSVENLRDPPAIAGQRPGLGARLSQTLYLAGRPKPYPTREPSVQPTPVETSSPEPELTPGPATGQSDLSPLDDVSGGVNASTRKGPEFAVESPDDTIELDANGNEIKAAPRVGQDKELEITMEGGELESPEGGAEAVFRKAPAEPKPVAWEAQLPADLTRVEGGMEFHFDKVGITGAQPRDIATVDLFYQPEPGKPFVLAQTLPGRRVSEGLKLALPDGYKGLAYVTTRDQRGRISDPSMILDLSKPDQKGFELPMAAPESRPLAGGAGPRNLSLIRAQRGNGAVSVGLSCQPPVVTGTVEYRLYFNGHCGQPYCMVPAKLVNGKVFFKVRVRGKEPLTFFMKSVDATGRESRASNPVVVPAE